MNKILKILLTFIFLTNCSFNENSKFWTKEEIIKEKKLEVEEIFKKEEALKLEFNPKLKISIRSKPIDKSFLINHDNNNGRINFNSNLQDISKFKFSKIKNFSQYDTNLSLTNNDFIFFDNKGTILKFNEGSKLQWKMNYYSKLEKKQNPILFFANNKKTLIVADNIAKYYALNIDDGKLLWSRNNSSPFNSQIKIYKDKFFVIDFENTLRAYSIKDGNEIWNIRTEKSLIRSQKKLSIIIINEKIYFNNSLGNISSVDINTGELLWQRPTQSSLIYDGIFFLKTSDIIANKNSIYFSNNKNQFFSIDLRTGTVNWVQKVNSNLRSTIIDDYIFAVSLEGYLVIIEKNSGNIIRSTDIFKNIKPKKRAHIKPTGFIVTTNNIYLTTNNGKLLVIDIASGQIKSTMKIHRKKISRPMILNQSLFVITDNSIIKLD